MSVPALVGGMPVLAAIACLAATVAAESAPPAMDPLRGEYGFLTVFDGISAPEARARVRRMAADFGVAEFQFYDAVEGYSNPPSADSHNWSNAAFHQPVRRSLLRAYVEEIRAQGGRSWLYVQAMGTDLGDERAQAGRLVLGQHRVDGRPLLDVVIPTRTWASRIATNWAAFAASMGFSGIHWDTLGDWDGGMATAAGADLPGFLREAWPALREHGLAQTANFVDGFGWDPRLKDRDIAFPYWEIWSVPTASARFFSEAVPGPAGGGVFVCYPGRNESHHGEHHNRLFKGTPPVELLIQRWQVARCTNNTYLAVGDGARHIQTEYFPTTAPLDDADVSAIQQRVFGPQLDCANTTLASYTTVETGRSSSAWSAWPCHLLAPVLLAAAFVRRP